MIVATIDQRVILPYRQTDDYSTAPYVYASLLSEDQMLLYNPTTGKFEVKTLSVIGHSHSFSGLSGKPTDLNGYGILDAYTKNQVDSLLSTVSVIGHSHSFSSLTSKPTTIGGYGIIDAYTKTEVGNLINNIDLSNYYTKSEINTLLSSVTVDLSNYYTKTEVNNLINNIDLSNYYTKTEVNNLINNIDLSNYYTKTEIDNKGYLTSLPEHNHDTRYYTETEINNILSGYLNLTGGTLTGSLNGTSGNFQTLSASTSITLNGRVLTIRTL